VESRAGSINLDIAVVSKDRDEVKTSGTLIINADDWGLERKTTDGIADCVARKSVSAVSAMVFMQDSVRAAEIARERGVDAGLHLNFTSSFSAPNASVALLEHQCRLTRFLRRHALARTIFQPGLVRSFDYVVAAQLDEFRRTYGREPDRIDGHHHMHLCANVLRQQLLPEGILVRRNFSFRPGEKSWLNRQYRGAIDRRLAKRHVLVDFLFPLLPIEPATHHERIFALAHHSVVEVETHPSNLDEYRFLTGEEVFRRAGGLPIAGFGGLPRGGSQLIRPSGQSVAANRQR
jgi:predicted glycoside hydrolase/deacetylase ChbG (UPF0249 family)